MVTGASLTNAEPVYYPKSARGRFLNSLSMPLLSGGRMSVGCVRLIIRPANSEADPSY